MCVIIRWSFQKLNNMYSFRLQNLFRITFARAMKYFDTRDWDGRKEEENIGYVPEHYLTDEEIKQRYL